MKPGDRVMCIDDKFPFVSTDQGIRYGEVYTVRWAGNYRHYIDGDFFGIKIAEIDRGIDPGGYGGDDMPFRASRFKPVVAPMAKKKEREVEKT